MAANETMSTTEPQLEEGVWTHGPNGELVPDYESTFPTINEGEVVHGTVVRVDKDEVLVDIGYKSEGVIPVAELSIRRSVNPADEVGVGEEVDALVLTKEDADGRLILSKKRARFELAWKAIESAAETGQPVTGWPLSAAASIDFQASSKRARFLDRIRRPSASSFVSTSASTSSPRLTSSAGLTERRIESSATGMTPSDL